MSNYVALNNVDHAELKVSLARSAALGDNIRSAPVVPREFRQLEAHYPIVFRKNSTNGQFEAVALFGFHEQENLFLDAQGWHADYIPLSVERLPFAIGYAYDSVSGEKNPVIHVDTTSARLSVTHGEPLFLTHGGNSKYLEHISRVLATLMEGLDDCEKFVALLQKLNLLEAFTLTAQLQTGSSFEISGYYTINEERLMQLDAQELLLLQRTGYLEAIYMAIASLTRIRILIKKKEQLAAGQ